MSAKDLPSPELLRQLLRYEPDTGKLYWRKRSPDQFNDGKQSAEHICKKWNSRFAGKEAFATTHPDGYKRGCILYREHLAHRVIWAIAYGEWVDEVDHINGIRDDNRISELRDGSNGINHKNKALCSDNTSGICGVWWDKSRQKWCAEIRSEGKKKYLGRFTGINDAIAARKKAEAKHGFHPNHGKR